MIPTFLLGKKYLRISNEERPVSRKCSTNPRSVWSCPGHGSNGWFIVVATTRGILRGPFVYCVHCNEWRGLDEEPHTTGGHLKWLACEEPWIHLDNSVFRVNQKIQSAYGNNVAPPAVPVAVVFGNNAAHPVIENDNVPQDIPEEIEIMVPPPPPLPPTNVVGIGASSRPIRNRIPTNLLTYVHEEPVRKRAQKRCRTASPTSIDVNIHHGQEEEEEVDEEDAANNDMVSSQSTQENEF